MSAKLRAKVSRKSVFRNSSKVEAVQTSTAFSHAHFCHLQPFVLVFKFVFHVCVTFVFRPTNLSFFTPSMFFTSENLKLEMIPAIWCLIKIMKCQYVSMFALFLVFEKQCKLVLDSWGYRQIIIDAIPKACSHKLQDFLLSIGHTYASNIAFVSWFVYKIWVTVTTIKQFNKVN